MLIKLFKILIFKNIIEHKFKKIENKKKVVEYAHPRGVVVEAELGKLAGIEDDVNVSAEDASYTNIPLKDLQTKPNNLIACIGRNRKIIIPSGNDFIQKGDSVVVITKDKRDQDITDILM